MSDCRDIVVCHTLFAVVGFGYVVVFGMGRVLVCDVSGVSSPPSPGLATLSGLQGLHS